MAEQDPNRGPKDLSPAEWKVMKIVWEQKEGAARDIYSVAGERHGWAVATVKTLLRRLVDKGYLHTKRVGNSYLYRPSRSAVTTLNAAAETFTAGCFLCLSGTMKPRRVPATEVSPMIPSASAACIAAYLSFRGLAGWPLRRGPGGKGLSASHTGPKKVRKRLKSFLYDL